MDRQHSSYYDKQSQKFKARQANSLMNVTGFFFGEQQQKKEEKKGRAFQPKDSEGINMQSQLVREQAKPTFMNKLELLDTTLDITQFIRVDQDTYEQEVRKSKASQQPKNSPADKRKDKLVEMKYDKGALDANEVFVEELCPIHFESLEFNDRNHLFNCLRSLMSD